jgi:hypothetical protein
MFKNGKMAFDVVWTDRDEAEKYCLGAYSGTAEVVGVYRQFTLTGEERKALEYGISEADAYDRVGLEDAKHAGIVFRGLLERLK